MHFTVMLLLLCVSGKKSASNFFRIPFPWQRKIIHQLRYSAVISDTYSLNVDWHNYVPAVKGSFWGWGSEDGDEFVSLSLSLYAELVNNTTQFLSVAVVALNSTCLMKIKRRTRYLASTDRSVWRNEARPAGSRLIADHLSAIHEPASRPSEQRGWSSYW